LEVEIPSFFSFWKQCDYKNVGFRVETIELLMGIKKEQPVDSAALGSMITSSLSVYFVTA